MRKQWMIAFVIGALMMAAAQQSPPAPAPTARMSKDGVKLPDALPRKFDIDMPLLKRYIGATPDELGVDVFSMEKGGWPSDLWQPVGCEWYAKNLDGAPYVGLILTGGRITEMRFFYPVKNKRLLKEVEGALETLAGEPLSQHDRQFTFKRGNVRINAVCRVTYGSAYHAVTMTVDHVDWRLLYVPASSPEIEEAMRARRPALGMTIEEATTVFGAPGSISHSDLSTNLAWSRVQGYSYVSMTFENNKATYFHID